MIDLLWLLAVGILVALLAVMIYVGRREEREDQPKETPAVCAWCVWRVGDVCNGEGSPVYLGECEPVCVGRLKCRVREVRREA